MNITTFCAGAFVGSLITFAAMCISYCIKSNDNEKELRQQLEEVSQKHYNECGQIAHYDDELGQAKELLRDVLPILHRAFFANYKDTNAANELYDKIKAAVGGADDDN